MIPNRTARWSLFAPLALAVGLMGTTSCGDSAASGDCAQLPNACPTAGALSCSGDTIRTCEQDENSCLVWSDTTTCGPGTFCSAGGCCGDGEISGGEVCDGANVGIATCQSLSLGSGTLSCLAGCDGYNTAGCDIQQVCGNGTIEGLEQCDGDTLGTASCETAGFHTGTVSCNADCTLNTSGCYQYCGDGIRNGLEDCDGNAMGAESCASLGYYFGTLTCDATCNYSTESCFQHCGDGIINGTEECDGNDLAGQDCFDFGHYSGSLSCDADCNIDTSTCAGICGDGVRNGFEACDGNDFATATCAGFGFAGGSLTCDASTCTIDTDSCDICITGQYNCYGNTVQYCDTTGASNQWANTATVCSAAAGQACDPINGNCRTLPVTGTAAVTGTYYQYAVFLSSSSAFLGGCDVGSLGDHLFVNRGAWYADGSILDVYKITLLDSDGDGLLEPNQHPSNPYDTGPIEQRVLEYVTSYNVAALGMVHRSENVPVGDRTYLIAGGTSPGTIFEYIFATGQTNVVGDAGINVDLGFLGLGHSDGVFYSGRETNRIVYSFHAPSSEWVAEFIYPSLAGGHFDGLEVVTSPSTGIQYVYVSDMTSDYLGQYRKSTMTGEWIQENVFQYTGTVNYVEGIGFGTLNHFWITGDGGNLYEIGGGDLSTYLDP